MSRCPVCAFYKSKMNTYLLLSKLRLISITTSKYSILFFLLHLQILHLFYKRIILVAK